MSKVALVNPNYYRDIYSYSKVKAAISTGTIQLGLASIAASLLKRGHTVKIIDLNLTRKPYVYFQEILREFRPKFVGITSTTPLIKKSYLLAELTKQLLPQACVIVGGPHPSALPGEVLSESRIDCVVRGEGEYAVNSIIDRGFSPETANIFYKVDGRILSSRIQDTFIDDLDSLPFPAYELFDIKRYFQPGITSRKAPLAYLETSRGCFSRCIFCNKNIHGYKMRMKSVNRVVDEMERILKLGFREIQIIDDVFTADMKRAYNICEEILRRGLKFPWYPRGGIRVDRVNAELLKIMKRSGCYRIPFGIESGSQRILDIINKNITLTQAEEAVRMAKESGLETECYFMLGLPTEKVEDLKMTVDFSIKLDPDYVKFAITVPFPGTSLFDSMQEKGQLKTRDWDKYQFSVSTGELYNHDSLSWKLLDRYYEISYRAFYFRPKYIIRTFLRAILNGTLLAHIKALLKTRW